MESSSEYSERYLALLEALNKAIQEGPWSHSLFLSVVGKSLTKFRDDLQVELNKIEPNSGQDAVAALAAVPAGMVEIYIALYCLNGNTLRNWENLLSTLDSTVVTRPIYRDEAHVRTLINSRPYKQNDAYCVIQVKETDIVRSSAGKTYSDKLGQELVVLKRAAIQDGNIMRFMHVSGEYTWLQGKLVLRASPN